MSKASLKKELATFTNEQLVEVLLNVYSSSKAAKEYLEFFLNPDVEPLYDKKLDIINKELRKTKWGRSKARISVIRNAIKDFASFGVGPEQVLRLQTATIGLLMAELRYLHYPETLINGTLRLVREAIILANDSAMLPDTLARLREYTERQGFSTATFRDRIRNHIADVIAEIAAGPIHKK